MRTWKFELGASSLGSLNWGHCWWESPGRSTSTRGWLAVELRWRDGEGSPSPLPPVEAPPVPSAPPFPSVEEAVRAHRHPGRRRTSDWATALPTMHAVDGCMGSAANRHPASKDLPAIPPYRPPTSPHCPRTLSTTNPSSLSVFFSRLQAPSSRPPDTPGKRHRQPPRRRWPGLSWTLALGPNALWVRHLAPYSAALSALCSLAQTAAPTCLETGTRWRCYDVLDPAAGDRTGPHPLNNPACCGPLLEDNALESLPLRRAIWINSRLPGQPRSAQICSDLFACVSRRGGGTVNPRPIERLPELLESPVPGPTPGATGAWGLDTGHGVSISGGGGKARRQKQKKNSAQPHNGPEAVLLARHQTSRQPFSSGRVPWNPSRWPTGCLSVEISTSTTYAWLLADDMAKAVLLRTAQPSTARRSTSKMGSRATAHTRS